MTEQRLNNCMLLHIHKDIADNLDLFEIVKDFILAKEERSRYFGSFVQQLIFYMFCVFYCFFT